MSNSSLLERLLLRSFLNGVIIGVNYHLLYTYIIRCSVAYVVRLIAGRADVACVRDPQHGVAIMIQEGLDDTNCAIVFILLYFFGMAASVW